MSVTSTTLAGVNVWQFSGAVTDAEIKTAWSALIVNQRYKPARYIYIDSTCSLVNVRGTYYVDCEAFGIILHNSRNKANTLFSNWLFVQTVGLSVGNRSNFVRVTNGTTITNTTTDGIDMKGGGFVYAVQGNPGGGDPRYLNEIMLGSLDGAIVTSAAYTEQEVEPTSIGTIWKGLNLQKVLAYPILANSSGTQRQVVYRSALNTESTSQRIVRPYYNNSACYVSSTVRRAGAAVTANLADTFGSTGTAVIMLLNNYTDESWFGASKTALTAANWNAGNRFIGGVMKKIQVQPSTLIRTYDSRSTTVSQKSTFSETTQDFLSGTDSTTADASTGRASIVCVGAIATGSGISITRYTGQRFTLQKFGYQVQVITPDMTFGDDDLSAFSTIIMDVQGGISRTEAAINAATSISSFQQLLEELHVLAIGLQGSQSYSGYNNGNLFDFVGTELKTNFTTVNVDATASSKISYNATTNTLTIKSANLVGNSTVLTWNNIVGAVNLLNGATIQGVYTSSTGVSAILNWSNLTNTSLFLSNGSGTQVDYQDNLTGTYANYLAPNSTGTWNWAAERYGYSRNTGSFLPVTGGNFSATPSWVSDIYISASKATVAAYTSISNLDQLYDYEAYWRTLNTGINSPLLTRNGSQLDFGAITIVLDATASSMFSYNAGTTTLTIKSTALVAGSKFDNIKANTFTLLNGATINCVYTNSVGTSTVLIITTTIAGYSLCVYKPDGTTKYYANNLAANTYYIYFTPSEAGSYTFAAENYGYRRLEEALSIAGGMIGSTLNQQEDVGITASFSTANAWTDLSGDDTKLYDGVAIYRLTEAGIKTGQIVTRDGTSLVFTPYNVVVNDQATNKVATASGTLTLKALTVNSTSKYDRLVTSLTKTITPADNELINVTIEDANGDSQLTIQGGSGTYQIWKLTNSTPNTEFQTGTLLTTTTNLKYRFIGMDGYKLFVYDTSTLYGSSCSMSKGTYTVSMFFGEQVQVAQAQEITQINEKIDSLLAKEDIILDDLTIINNGVKKASILVPHNQNL